MNRKESNNTEDRPQFEAEIVPFTMSGDGYHVYVFPAGSWSLNWVSHDTTHTKWGARRVAKRLIREAQKGVFTR